MCFQVVPLVSLTFLGLGVHTSGYSPASRSPLISRPSGASRSVGLYAVHRRVCCFLRLCFLFEFCCHFHAQWLFPAVSRLLSTHGGLFPHKGALGLF